MKWTMEIAVAARSIMSLRRSFSSFNGAVTESFTGVFFSSLTNTVSLGGLRCLTAFVGVGSTRFSDEGVRSWWWDVSSLTGLADLLEWAQWGWERLCRLSRPCAWFRWICPIVRWDVRSVRSDESSRWMVAEIWLLVRCRRNSFANSFR